MGNGRWAEQGRTRRLAAGLLALVASAGLALGHPEPERPAASEPSVPEAVLDRLGAAYLTEEERRELRLAHGLWNEADLSRPADRAQAALAVGALRDASLEDETVPAVLRADAARRRGEPARALELLGVDPSIPARRVRAEALHDLARFEDAAAEGDAVVAEIASRAIGNADEAADAARTLLIRLRVRAGEDAAGDYRAIEAMLAAGRERLDRLSPTVRLAEAMLLSEKHNRAQAQEAAVEAAQLHPRLSEAVALLGELAVDAFDFERAERVAQTLDRLAQSLGDEDAQSPEGAMIRVRARLREREGAEAAVILDAALAAFPTHRRLLALRAAAAATRFDDDATRAALDELDSLSPGTALGHFEVGAALAEARQYGLAPPFLRAAAERQPAWSAPWIELGLLELQNGNDAASLSALNRALALDPFNIRAANTRTLVEQLLTWPTIRTEHFIIRHAPGVDAVLASEMPAALERIYDRVAGDGPLGLEHEPARPTTIELMPAHDSFAVRITGMPDLWTMAAATGPAIAMESPRRGPGLRAGPYDWPRVLQHEFSHTVALSRSNNRIPHWMTEGLAVLHEDGPRDGQAWRILRDAFLEDRLFSLSTINIAFVRPERPTDRSQAYAQAAWMLEFVADRSGEDAINRIIDRFGAGQPPERAFGEELGLNAGDFLEAFALWAEADLRRVGMLPPEGVPTVAALVERDADTMEAAEGGPVLSPQRVEVWLAEFPRHPDLLELAVRQRLDAAGGEPAEADRVLLERLAEARPGDEFAHRLLARLALSSADPARRLDAIEHLRVLDAREQYTPVYAEQLATLSAEAGDASAAHAAAERATQIAPFEAPLRELAARTSIAAGALADAERHIAALAAIEPDRDIHAKRLEAVRRLRAGRSGD